jgi:hypothetical protein
MWAAMGPRLAEAANAASSARQIPHTCDAKERKAWERLVDHTLIEWGRDPAVLEDDGVVAPSVETVKRACEVSAVLRRLEFPPPTRIVPTGDGGIAFQVDGHRDFVSVEIAPDGAVEYLRFSDSKLVERYEVSIPASAR